MQVKFYLFIFLTAITASACTRASESNATDKVELTKRVNQKKHIIFNNEVEFWLDHRFERFNNTELLAIKAAQTNESFINQMFGEDQLQLAESLGAKYYVFIDTVTYSDIIQFERLDKLIPINKAGASIIGGIFKKRLQQADPTGQVQIQNAKFGAQPSFTYGYYKMKSKSPLFETYSNHFAISSANASYILYNISLSDLDYSNLKTHLEFR